MESEPRFFDLMGLPTSILERIYDMLAVYDRAKLNMALLKQDMVTKTTMTCTETNMKLATMHRYFKRRMGSNILSKDLSSEMFDLITTNLTDPTVVSVLADFPALAVGLRRGIASARLIALIELQQVFDLGQYTGDIEVNCQSVEDVRHALEVYGTPEIYDLFMAHGFPFREAVQNNWESFVFGIVCKRNRTGLLPHIMQLSVENANLTRLYLAQTSTLIWFLTEPDKLQQVVDHVGVTTIVLNQLLDTAASHLFMRSVTYLEHALYKGAARD